jgi:hypothetical protein
MQRDQQAPKPQGQDRGPQGKPSAQEPKHGQEKDGERGGEHNK